MNCALPAAGILLTHSRGGRPRSLTPSNNSRPHPSRRPRRTSSSFTSAQLLATDNAIDQCGCCFDGSPIILDLKGDGYRLSAAVKGAIFDVNGLGHVMWLGRPLASDDAWLALDRDGNGAIDSGAELFGNVTRLNSGRAARHGYEALAEFDDNNDGWIDGRDAVFARLLAWSDVNRDGVSQAAELNRLAETGVKALSLSPQSSRRRDGNGNEFRLRAKLLLENGAERFSHDVWPDTALLEV